MNETPPDPHVMRDPDLSRRRFLHATVSAGAAAWAGLHGAVSSKAQQAFEPAPDSVDVYEVLSEGAVAGKRAHPIIAQEMLDQALLKMGAGSRPADTWREWLNDDDIIAIKFNQSGVESIGTIEGVAHAIINSLKSADIDPGHVMLLEAPPTLVRDLGTRLPPTGWAGEEFDFGSGTDQFVAALDEASALINVPFLKTHNLAGASSASGQMLPGMTGCLKNLSHGLVKHPARYHGNGCSPFIGDIVASRAIRPKLRLNIVNALRVMFDRGPEAPERFVHEQGMFLMSRDPVAADTLGLYWLNRIRKERGLALVGGTNGDLEYLAAAHRSGAGVGEVSQLRRHFIQL